MLLLDTSGLLAAIDAGQRRHDDCVRSLNAATPPYLLSPFVLAELDYLLGTHVGPIAQEALLDEIARGVYRLEPFDANDVQRAKDIMASTETYSPAWPTPRSSSSAPGIVSATF